MLPLPISEPPSSSLMKIDWYAHLAYSAPCSSSWLWDRSLERQHLLWRRSALSLPAQLDGLCRATSRSTRGGCGRDAWQGGRRQGGSGQGIRAATWLALSPHLAG